MRIAVLGAGAVGGYFGGRLVQNGGDVTFIVRPRRKARLDDEGLCIESPSAGNVSLPVVTVTPEAITAPFDVVMLSCKAYDLDDAVASVRPAVGRETVIVPLLNGLAHLDRLDATFGDRVAGGLAKIAATLTPQGAVRHLNDWQFITFGPRHARQRPSLEALHAAFVGTEVVATLSEQILSDMWEKLVHLGTVAGMTTLMRASLGDIAQTDEGASISLRLLEANATLAAREGYPVSDGALGPYRALVSDPASPYTASMLRDMERGGPVEADHIVGHLHRLAVTHGVEPDLYRIIRSNLQAYEVRRAAGRV